MAHDPNLGFADYFSAADASASSVTTLMPAMDEAAPELFGLQAGMELLGVRGLGMSMMPGAAGKVAALVADAGDDGGAAPPCASSASSTNSRARRRCRCRCAARTACCTSAARRGRSTNWRPRPMDDAPRRVVVGAASARRVAPAQLEVPPPAQQLLQEFCSLPVDSTKRGNGAKAATQQEDGRGDGSSSSSASWTPSPQIQAMEALELQRLKDKLYIMLEEV